MNLFQLFRKKRIKWVSNPESKGEHLFTFDGVKVYNLFRDYPWALTKEEKEIFDRENPYWADFFRDRENMAAPQSEFPQVDNEETNLLHQAISRKTPGYVPENSISNEETRLLEQLLSGTSPDEE